jgi:hypothetical protein
VLINELNNQSTTKVFMFLCIFIIKCLILDLISIDTEIYLHILHILFMGEIFEFKIFGGN